MNQPDKKVPSSSVPIAAPLVFSDRLYGRSRELAALTRAFSEVGAGAGRVLLLPGHSGSGKTALVQSLRHPIREENGFLLEGKFNQYQQGIPLFPLRQALHQLARELRTTDPSEQQRWKARVLGAVGGLGGLLTELSPEWEALLGPQPPVPEISPYEAPHRFALVLRQFLGVFCRAEHPVVLFIDDWQWADVASLIVLQQLQVATGLRYLLVLAAYRDNEVGSTHPFLVAVEELRRQAVPVDTLPVLDLGLADVRSLLSDTLTPAAEDVDQLTSFLHATTHGNPFFLRSLLESLHARRALWFEPSQSCWRWDGRSLVAHDGAEDVVQLFVQNLRQLSAECRHLLSVAACLGNRFDLEALSMVSGLSSSDCLQRLGLALQQRVILPFEGGRSQYLFQHDRVQQAAHSLIARDQLPAVRLKIARLLLEHLTPQQLDERLLEVTDHYNSGRALLRDETEQRRLVELNIAAGRKARAATAYHAMLQFHRVAGEFLARPGFDGSFCKEHHEQALQFFKDWGESEFIEGHRTQAEACIRKALDHAQTPLETADVLCVLILQNTLLACYHDAITAGCRALAALGITLPESDFEATRDADIAQVRRHLAGRTIASLRDVPPMSEPTMLMAIRVLITMGPPCYRAHQRLWSVLVPKVVDLTLQYGPVPQIGYSHTAFGGLLGWVDNDYSTAKEFGDLASRLMHEVFTSPSDQSVFYLMVGSSIRHWFTHLRAASEDYAHAWEAGLRSGNLQYAAYAFGHNMYCRFYQGIPLERMIKESQQSLVFSRTRTNQWAIDLLEGGLQIFGSLAIRESSASWQEATYLQEVDAHQNIQVACIYRVLKAFSLLILGEHERALAASDEAEPLIYTVGTQGLLPWPEHVFTRLLILAALYPQAEAKRRARWRGEMDRVVARLEVWASHAPENYRFKLAMARAESACLEGLTEEALELYDEAARAAQTGGFTQWEAWAFERAALLALAIGEAGTAHIYWQNAYFAYHRWGALAKVSLMEQELFSKSAERGRAPTPLHARLERQVEWLRAQAASFEEAHASLEKSRIVKELAEATEFLREEVVHRKKMESELQQHREQLSQEIAARTKDLETSQELAKQSAVQAKRLTAQQNELLAAQAATLNLVEDAINERNRAEQISADLRMSESRRSFALEAARMGTWDWDVSCGRFTLDHTHEALWGYTPGSFSGTYEGFVSRIHPDDLPKLQRLYEQAKQSWEPFQDEHRVIWPDGSERWINSHGRSVFDNEGRLTNLVGVAFDITERKQNEAKRENLQLQLAQSQKMESVGQLAGGISHDFNNLLSIINGYAQMLHDDEMLKESQRLKLEEIMRAGELATSLTRQLLMFSRRQPMESQVIDLNDTVSVMSKMLRRLIPENIKMEISAQPELWHIKVDPGQIEQMIMNLTVNARDAMPDGGKLTVKTENVVIEGTYNHVHPSDIELGHYVVLSISDTGCGMDENVKQHMFEPFFTTKEKGNGTGLGLAIVYSVVKQANAFIDVQSELGKGTGFRIYFPRISHECSAAETASKSMGISGGSETILLAEDQNNLRELIREFLQSIGYCVLSSANAEEALEHAKNHNGPIHMLLTDIVLPEISGFELAKMIRKSLPDIKMLFMSGHIKSSETHGMISMKDNFIQKPISIYALASKLRELLKQTETKDGK